jgi:ABC-type transporter Mla subunit MlaD
MRRIALIAGLLAVAAGTVVAPVGADDKRTYQAELFNAFGLVEGSELRVGGVKAGTVTDLDITPEKTALVTFEVGPEFPEFKSDASCSSEPQSLIAEYFLDCQPGNAPDALEGPIEAARNQTTVQNDLVQNTLREPFKRRFQLIINEFGTALVGNSENLNAAIRSGAPALRELRKVLKILGRQNRIIAELNANSDEVFAKLTERREDVVRFIDEAEDTARVSADRREDLSTNFDLLDDFLAELDPVMIELGNLAREQTPLMTDLGQAAPGLNQLATNLPKFNDASKDSLKALGSASQVGERALTKSRDEISELKRAAEKSVPAADVVAGFLENLDDPRNAVEETCFARRDLREQPGEADRRVGLLESKLGTDLQGDRTCPFLPGTGGPMFSEPGTGNPGYTGLESLLNYGYIQTISLNLFSQIGHALHVNLIGIEDAAEGGAEGCGHHSETLNHQIARAPELGGGHTQDARDALRCTGYLGDYQPGVTPGTYDPATGLALGLPRYDKSVCPDGSTWLTICDPALSSPRTATALGPQQQAQAQQPASPIDDVLPKLPKLPNLKDLTPKQIRDILGLPPGAPIPTQPGAAGVPPLGLKNPQSAPPSSSAPDLLNFLFGS